MKIIHTSDWHLGRILNSVSFIEDQEYVLKKLLGILENEKPDVLLIAGDIYDRNIPPAQAVLLLNDVINKIIFDLKIKTIIISGNHDSGERLNFGSRILKKNGLFIASTIESCLDEIVIEDDFGKINFWTVPYLSPSLVKVSKNIDIHNHNDIYKIIIGEIKEKLNLKDRHILITHAFATGAVQTEESETALSVGGSEQIDLSHFDCFDYTALGHLHRPQKVGNDKIRYSGSLLQYSFSEENHKKCVYKIEIEKNKKMSVNEIHIKPQKPLRKIAGLFDEVYENAKSGENQEDYIKIKLTDKISPFNPLERLKEFYPNILQLERERLNSNEKSSWKSAEEFKNVSDKDLFLRFYKDTKGYDFDKTKIKVLEDLLEEFNKSGMETE